MHTVLIVDDEEPVLESYGFILENGVDGFRLAGKARSGYEAIKLIYELNPDIVFMDINMPGIDGLDTIAEVHEKFSDTVFVLSTAYERFDLATRAIPLGVFAYLVKPVSKKLFVETLLGISAALEKRKTVKSDPGTDLFLHQFMDERIWKEQDAARWLQCRERLHLDSDRGLVCFIGLDSDQDIHFTRINSVLELKYRFFFTIHLNLGMYFFPGDNTREELARTVPETIAPAVPDGMLCLAGFGSVRDGPSLYLSCTEALEELNRKKDRTDVRLRERLRIIELRRKMGLSDCEELRALFDAFWEEVFASYEFGLAKAKMVSLFSLLVDDCTGCYQSHTDEPPPFVPAEEIYPLASLSLWKDWALSAFNRLYLLSRQKRTGKFPVPLVKALAFIDANYTRQIQLPDAAEAASVSAAYLSRLFGEHMNTAFIDYLTVMRVEQAEKLIRENNMNIKEVAFAVGYQDPNYFSKIFRKLVGVSPSMYAERSRYEKN